MVTGIATAYEDGIPFILSSLEKLKLFRKDVVLFKIQVAVVLKMVLY